MSSTKPVIASLFTILGIGLGCFLLFLLLMPNVEASRNEARLVEAYHQVCQISNAHHEAPSRDPFAAQEILDTDPWGQPYRFVQIDGKQIRVLSSGPNMRTLKTGVDEDDIYSDMEVSPIVPIRAQKKRRFMIAVGVSAGAWIVLTVFYIRRQKFSHGEGTVAPLP